MDKSLIKNFAIDARNALRAAMTKRLGHFGIGPDDCHQAQLHGDAYVVKDLLDQDVLLSPWERLQHDALVRKVSEDGFAETVEEIAYTIFNRLVAIRFMEINDYLPTHERVLSGQDGAIEPEIVTAAPDIALDLTDAEKAQVYAYKNENKMDDLFRFLFFKQCEALGDILPGFFTRTEGYVELLFNLSYLNPDGVIRKLISIPEDNFLDQVEIVGSLYQYYNNELKDETYALLNKKVKVTKNRLPSVTQLFTPDWIVKYMVENSLGRLWLDGHEKDEAFDWKYYIEDAEQEPDVQAQLDELHRQAAELAPEDITVIDPCMGSGHILAYAFDVLMDIYKSQGYRPKDAVPAILEHNLYGLDIDERAWQLAYFSVMMKARQYYSGTFRKHLTCHLYYFVESNHINRDDLQYFGGGMDELTRNVVLPQLDGLLDAFTDARLYGSLLKIDNYDWELLHQFVDHIQEENDLFAGDLFRLQQRLKQIVDVGEILARKYDIVVTNPPYMNLSNLELPINTFVKKLYPDSKGDLFAVFIDRCNELTLFNRYQSMITQHSWMFLSSYEKLRMKLLTKTFVNMVHLGARAFEDIGGEVVQTTSFVIFNNRIFSYKATYCRLIEIKSAACKENKFLKGEKRYLSLQDNFSKIPGSPIAYWVGDTINHLFGNCERMSDFALPKHGMSTGNNDKCLRLWFEVSISKIKFDALSTADFDSSHCKYAPYKKGGTFRLWYGNNDYIIAYDIRSRNLMKQISGYRASSLEYFFKPSINWSDTSSTYFGVRISPEGFAFDGRGASMFCPNKLRRYLAGLLASSFTTYILNILNPTLTFSIENISSIPVIVDDKKKEIIDNLVSENVDLSKSDWDSFETSWDFKRHPFILKGVFSSKEKVPEGGGFIQQFTRAFLEQTHHLSFLYNAYKTMVNARFDKLKANEEELNRIFIDIYGLQDELTPDVADKDVTVARIYDTKDDIPASMQGNSYVLTKADVVKSFISYAVGCMFGRYSLDVDGLAYAGGDWDDSKYQTFIPDADDIIPITDDEYFDDDIVARFIAFLRIVYGEDTLNDNMHFIATALGGRGTDRDVIRNYFLKDFFKDHCKTYKKRPIYWLMDSGKKNGFKALFYLHRYTPNLVGRARTEYLHGLQGKMQSVMDRNEQVLDMATTSAAEKGRIHKQQEKLTAQLAEMQRYDEIMQHIALQRIVLDLDDGVKVNYAKFQDIVVDHADGTKEKMNLLAKLK